MQKFLARYVAQHGLKPTHVSMKGGQYKIPQSLDKVFLKHYEQQVKSGEQLSLVELAQVPYHPLFVDLDFGKDVAVDSGLVSDIMDALMEGAVTFFKVDRAESFVGKSSVQWNLHVHFPGITVNREAVRGYRELVLGLLHAKHEGVNWKKVYDSHDTQIRMLGQCKADKPGVYLPFVHATYTLKDEEGVVVDADKRQTWHCAQECAHSCVVGEESVPGLFLRSMQVRGGTSPTSLRPAAGSGGSGGSGVRGNGFEGRQHAGGALIQVNIAQDELTRLVSFMGFGQYSKTKITHVVKVKGKDILLLRQDSKRCQNLKMTHNKGCHTSSNVYFFLSRRVVKKHTYFTFEQRCFCGKDTSEDRRHGECSQFRHPLIGPESTHMHPVLARILDLAKEQCN